MYGLPGTTAVVCENYRQFRMWCRDNDRNPQDPSLRYVAPDVVHKVQGCIFTDLIEIGFVPAHVMDAVRARLLSEVMR